MSPRLAQSHDNVDQMLVNHIKNTGWGKECNDIWSTALKLIDQSLVKGQSVYLTSVSHSLCEEHRGIDVLPSVLSDLHYLKIKRW